MQIFNISGYFTSKILRRTPALITIDPVYSLLVCIITIVIIITGDRRGTVVKVLRYKSDGRWFDPRWCHWNWNNPADRIMILGSTQLLTEMSTRSLPGGKGSRCVGLTTLPPSCAVVMKSGKLNFLEPSGPLQACKGNALPFLPLYYYYY
jgi:hypothetical protein